MPSATRTFIAFELISGLVIGVAFLAAVSHPFVSQATWKISRADEAAQTHPNLQNPAKYNEYTSWAAWQISAFKWKSMSTKYENRFGLTHNLVRGPIINSVNGDMKQPLESLLLLFENFR